MIVVTQFGDSCYTQFGYSVTRSLVIVVTQFGDSCYTQFGYSVTRSLVTRWHRQCLSAGCGSAASADAQRTGT